MKDLIKKAIVDASDDKVLAFNTKMETITSKYLKVALDKAIKEKEKEVINKYK